MFRTTTRIQSKSAIQKEKKHRALALLEMFSKRIKKDLFDVEMANWWEAGSPNKIIFRIDCTVKDLEDLDEIQES